MRKAKEHERVIMTTLMFNRGLIPIENTMHDVGRVLKQLPATDALKAKRKFRKEWRKLAKKRAKAMKNGEKRTSRMYGIGNKNPTRWEREARKRLVVTHLYEEIAKPIIDRFENGGKVPGKDRR